MDQLPARSDVTVVDRETSDLELMARVQGGDTVALQRLIDCYWPALVKYAYRLLDDHDMAEDVVQDAFVALWEERTRWWPASAPRPVLYRIARNLALNELKAQAARRRLEQRQRDKRSAPPPTPIQWVEAEELRQATIRAVDALPPRRREVFVLARFHGLTYREIAEVMEIAPQTVANQMMAALAAVQRSLTPLLRHTVTDIELGKASSPRTLTVDSMSFVRR
jgi:RNA polymerase sigma-70 factor (ECF subfamily)